MLDQDEYKPFITTHKSAWASSSKPSNSSAGTSSDGFGDKADQPIEVTAVNDLYTRSPIPRCAVQRYGLLTLS